MTLSVTAKAFPRASVLTMTTGRLFCEMPACYQILNHMTQDNLFTHQLARAQRECYPYLLRQFPMLEDVSVDEFDALYAVYNGDAFRALDHWFQLLDKRGVPQEFLVEPIPRDDHDVINPLVELQQMMPGATIVIVEKPEE